MSENSKSRKNNNLLAQKMPERDRAAVLGRVAEQKRLRDLEASQVMKEHEAKRTATLAKTARLRAERLARLAETPPPQKTKSRKKT
jgi:hypothetical protein